MPLGDSFSLVVHQVRSPDNLGAIARLMANFGFGRLALSDPRTYGFAEAEKMAIRGEQVLERARLCATLDEALADAVYAVGTTSRQVEGRPSLTPEEGVARLARHAERGPVALVLGGEKRGLSDDELLRCQDIVVIPTRAEQPSMNLSQAASVLLYLCAREDAKARADVQTRDAAESKPTGAKLGTVKALEQQLEKVLLDAGFLNEQAPQHILGELTRSLLRGELSQREVELWLTAFKKLERALGRK